MNQHVYAKQTQPIHMSGSENGSGHSEGKAIDETAAWWVSRQEGQPCVPYHTPQETDSMMAALLTLCTLSCPLPCPLPVTKKQVKNLLLFLSMSN